MYLSHPMPRQIERGVVNKLLRVQTATVGHTRHHGFMSSALRPILPGVQAAGTAVTVLAPASDSTILHHAMGLLRPGDFLIIDRCGDERHACWGGVISHAGRAIGLAGVIIDGAATDPQELREHGVPVWSRSISGLTTKPAALGGQLNVPVSCGGVAVLPGDAILADESGILVLRPEEVDAIIEAALQRQEREPALVARIHAGERVADVSGAAKRLESLGIRHAD